MDHRVLNVRRGLVRTAVTLWLGTAAWFGWRQWQQLAERYDYDNWNRVLPGRGDQRGDLLRDFRGLAHHH
jgi:hypothetical protein